MSGSVSARIKWVISCLCFNESLQVLISPLEFICSCSILYQLALLHYCALYKRAPLINFLALVLENEKLILSHFELLWLLDLCYILLFCGVLLRRQLESVHPICSSETLCNSVTVVIKYKNST